jgi:hypothetical protein
VGRPRQLQSESMQPKMKYVFVSLIVLGGTKLPQASVLEIMACRQAEVVMICAAMQLRPSQVKEVTRLHDW